MTVIILTINQREQTLRCLEHLLRSEPERDFDVLVWDNGSTDDTAETVARAYPQVAVRASDVNLGVAGGRNAAAAAARELFEPDLLLFLDNDIVVMPGFVSALRAPFTGGRGASSIGQTQAKLRLADAPERLNDGGGCRLQLWLGRTRPVGYGEIDRGQYDRPRQCISCGGAMMVRAAVFEQLGGFDESFNPFGPEDIDFSLRLQKAGFQAWYVPGAVACHDVNHTFGADYSEDYARYRARHWMRLMRRHARLPDWFGFVFVGAPLIAFRVLVREGRRRNLGALRGLFRGALQRK